MNFKVVKNLPEMKRIEKLKSRVDLDLPENKSVLILQGAGINIDRGAEELTEAMRNLEDCFLVIIGSGDVFPVLEDKLKNDPVLSSRIRLVNKLRYSEMMQYTLNSDIGFSLDKNTNPNYLYSLPNKIFDYIKAGVPVIVSDLVEIGKVVHQYEVGEVISSHNSDELSKFIQSFLKDKEKMEFYKRNCQKAMQELNWESQKNILKGTYSGLT
jgi:glycosyltransferase involved in cell wall biosynthesis